MKSWHNICPAVSWVRCTYRLPRWWSPRRSPCTPRCSGCWCGVCAVSALDPCALDWQSVSELRRSACLVYSNTAQHHPCTQKTVLSLRGSLIVTHLKEFLLSCWQHLIIHIRADIPPMCATPSSYYKVKNWTVQGSKTVILNKRIENLLL